MKCRGFTLIELLVVLAIVATLLSLVAPRYFAAVDKAKEAVLRTNLRIVREAIDKHLADTGRFPPSLQSLVERRYLQAIPVDPMTERTDTWIFMAPGAREPDASAVPAELADIRSGAMGEARDGSAYVSW